MVLLALGSKYKKCIIIACTFAFHFWLNCLSFFSSVIERLERLFNLALDKTWLNKNW